MTKEDCNFTRMHQDKINLVLHEIWAALPEDADTHFKVAGACAKLSALFFDLGKAALATEALTIMNGELPEAPPFKPDSI